MSILVTGGAGYIGSHLTVELIKAGYKVIILDNLSNSRFESVNRIREITGETPKFYKADLCNKQSIIRIFEDNKIEVVIHLAGLKSVGESVTNPLHYYQNNISGTINLFEVMKVYNVKKLVFSSSAAVYGIPSSVPIIEDFPLRAINPYARTKLMIEEILNDINSTDDTWSIVLLRYFNPIGAHESGKIGENPNGTPNNLMPYITQVAIGKLDKLNVYGGDYPTIDGTGVRDYIHVVDLAKGHIKALEKVMSFTGIESYNLGTGKGYSVLEVINAFERVSGKKIPYQIVERRKGDVALCYADATKAQKDLKWIATFGIEEMCRDAWRWQRKNPSGYESN